MRALCALLGDPQNELNVIHVAGTNGKGSVCRYLYEVLLAHGYSVGLFTSPGLGDFRSRIEANGAWISDADLNVCTDTVLDAVAKIDGDSPTEFEVLTAVALVYFAQTAPVTEQFADAATEHSIDTVTEHCADSENVPPQHTLLRNQSKKHFDFVILEVGLGGALDSTNVIGKPLVSVITEIGLDHTEYLGDTIATIASEKAGVIKPDCPVVTSASGEAARVIARRAYEIGAPFVNASAKIYGARPELQTGHSNEPCASVDSSQERHMKETVGRDGLGVSGIKCHVLAEELGGTVFSCEIRGVHYSNIEIAMPGRHQVRNAVCALAAFDALRHAKASGEGSVLPVRSDSEALRNGMKAARLPGRFEIVSGDAKDTEGSFVIHGDARAHSAAEDAASTDMQRSTAEDASADKKGRISPLVILDGAHNQAGVAALRAAVNTLLPDRRILVLIAMMRDKQTD
ncbi:MAG: hypothetical protein LBT52_01650, partial [Clostridiales Family XIII bacterium]|nr:hypothetical protein [Clostridiales Family XIII bacterium]